MRLRYKAISTDGKQSYGIIEAKNVAEASTYLHGKKLMPIHIVIDRRKGILRQLPFFGNVKSSDVVYFTRQLSSMVSSGLTLVQSLAILKDQVQNPAMGEVISGLLSDIEEGKSFYLSLIKYPDVFSPVYVSSVRAAEESGLLDKVMARLADNLEKKEKLKKTIRSALLYPSFILIGMIGVIVVMMVFVIPQISILYVDIGIELPFATKIVVESSNFFTKYWPFVGGVVFLSLFLLNRWHKTETGKLIIDSNLLKIPIFGKLTQQSILTEFTRTVSLLVGSGTLIVDAIKQSEGVTENIVFRNAIEGVAKRIEKGVSISDAMNVSKLFPPIVVQMSRVGEETGKLDESLMKVSEYYEGEVDETVKTLTTALEPFIMVVLGAGVGFLIFAVITPIYSLIAQIS